MTFTFSHDHEGITVTPNDLDATIEWYSDNLGTIIELAEPGTWPGAGRAHV